MTEAIVSAYERLVETVGAFNEKWPALVVGGMIWRIPLLTEQRTPSQINVQLLTGTDAIKAAVAALHEFERDLDQAPGTVLRLPGFFILSGSILEEGRAVNRCKSELVEAIEAERVFRNVAVSRRSHIMRQALGKNFSLNQLKRGIQVFDAAPRQITFTWAGHTSGKERVTVGHVREALLAEAHERSMATGEPVMSSPQWIDLRSIANMAETDVLDVPKPIAPHPRAMLWFSDSSRYDAMLHANLPFFVLRGNSPPKVVGLKDFDRTARTAKRPDTKSREPALPGGRFFVAEDSSSSTGAPAAGSIAGVESTYAESLSRKV
ncbi:replication terminus site-binding protein [Pseudomonas aeruginosa]|uniref:DNA replication terminus site-binding family protein n=2 Tax=Pseudomonas aeruginosa group TaxID=136841 RepID=A0A2R3IKR6_9PSED|nr:MULTISPECIES: DNA replication terminus site-binding protein [Pseudomonas aeruginosa group]AVK02522.1 DNA replication terminus site-binding family protein [Pseudomonas paraeruginosa]AWE88954.1 DNA replication terminus site-binding family protein [Pseudomonas paraeruginosa]EIU2643077.1 replication terminus site-binding protein [Pseudomonas aeruginosa]EIU9544419.1 replication terminus site-binding protein [Pseudomonas aeruginosa]EIU9551538.1 replication terminus site-binding protein [Pseudomon